ncbi:MAG: A/G-specific adenine glycosylase, partial [Lentisphaeria bacterium]|nr:A/G-specific adenine glycosylase [Lentisphaeria bacterium]
MKQLVEPLLAWYAGNKRVLPWRSDPQPYHVWISEIMLQQTRVETVIPYYERFLAELPTVQSLAAVPEERLLKLW